MATVTSLGFSIFSRFDGSGTTRAKASLSELRREIIGTNLAAVASTSGYKGMATAIAAVGVAMLPVASAAGATTAATLSMATSGAAAFGAYGVAAAGAIKRALDAAESGKKLTASQKTFIGAVNDGKKAWEGFIDATQNKTLAAATVVTQGLTNTLKLMPQVVDAIHPVVMKVANAFKDWTERDNGLQRFIDTIKKHGVPAMDALQGAARHMLAFLGEGFRAFAPMGVKVAEALERGAKALRNWAEGGGFQRWIDSVRKNGPQVRDFFDALIGAIGRILEAVNGLSMPLLSLITLFLRLVEAMPIGLLQAFIVAWAALRLAIIAYHVQVAITTAFMYAAGVAMRVFHGAVLLVRGAIFLAVAAWRLLNLAFVGSPIGIIIVALLALVAGIVYLATQTQVFQTIWNAIWAGLKTATLAVWNALQVAWSVLWTAIKAVWDAFSAPIIAAWQAIWPELKAVFMEFTSGVQSAWSIVWTALQAIWNAFITVFGPVFSAAWTTIVAVATVAWEVLKVAWQVIWTVIQAVWNAFVAIFVPVFQAAWTGIVAVATAVWEVLKAAWNVLWTVITAVFLTLFAIFTGHWGTAWNAIKDAAVAIWELIKAGWNLLVQAFLLIWNTVSAGLTAAWNVVWGAIQAVAQAIWTAIQAAWQAVVSAFQTIWTTVSAALQAAWSAFWTALQTAAQAVWTALQTAWQAFFTALNTIWTTFSSALTTAWNALWAALTAAWSAFSNLIGAAWQTFFNVLTNIWSAFSNLIGAAWQTFFNVLTNIWSAFSNLIGAAWQTFFNVLTNIWSAFSNTLGAAWEAFWNTLRNTAERIWELIKKVISDAINAILKPINKLIDGFNAIGNVFGLPDIPNISVSFENGGMVGGEPTFSAGGTVNMTKGGTLAGFAPGRDRVPAMLSRGEGVLVPEAVRGLGGPGFVHSANQHFSNGRTARQHGRAGSWHGGNMDGLKVHGFAEGGMVPAGTVLGERGGRTAVTMVPFLPAAMGAITLAALARAGIPTSAITQPEYNPGVAASAGTHDRGGVIDLAPNAAYIPRLVAAGFAAWMRTPAQGFSPHIHAVLLNHPDLSPAAAAQAADWAAGGDGLGVGGGGGGGVGAIFGEVLKNIAKIVRGIVELEPVRAVLSQFLGPLGDVLGLDGGGDDDDGGGGLFGTGIGPDVGPDIVPGLDDGGIPGAIAGAASDVLGGMLDMIMQMIFASLEMTHLDFGFGLREDALGGADTGSHWFGDLMHGAGDWLLDKAKDFIMSKKPAMPTFAGGGGDVQQWAPLAALALARAGLSANQLPAFLALMQAESGGNPLAINLTDINAQNGVPSQGLMQVIPPTFAAYRDPSLPNNILDPLANMVAAANYIKARYGGQVPGSPYYLGTPGATRGWHLVGEDSRGRGGEWVKFRGGEKVLPHGELPPGRSDREGSGTWSPQFIFNVEGNMDERAVDKFNRETLPELRRALEQGVGRRG